MYTHGIYIMCVSHWLKRAGPATYIPHAPFHHQGLKENALAGRSVCM